jgi:hypothetical protein
MFKKRQVASRGRRHKEGQLKPGPGWVQDPTQTQSSAVVEKQEVFLKDQSSIFINTAHEPLLGQAQQKLRSSVLRFPLPHPSPLRMPPLQASQGLQQVPHCLFSPPCSSSAPLPSGQPPLQSKTLSRKSPGQKNADGLKISEGDLKLLGKGAGTKGAKS